MRIRVLAAPALALATLTVLAPAASASVPTRDSNYGRAVWCVKGMVFNAETGVGNAQAARGHIYRNVGGHNYMTVCDGRLVVVRPFLSNGCSLFDPEPFAMPRRAGDNREHSTYVQVCFF